MSVGGWLTKILTNCSAFAQLPNVPTLCRILHFSGPEPSHIRVFYKRLNKASLLVELSGTGLEIKNKKSFIQSHTDWKKFAVEFKEIQLKENMQCSYLSL